MSKMPTEIIAKSILAGAREALSDPFIVKLLTRKVKFENWLQVRLAESLAAINGVEDVCLERTTTKGLGVDIVCCLDDKTEVGIEIKLYVCGKAVSDTRKSIQKDILKLQQLQNGGYVLVVVYGYQSPKDRSNALLKVEEVLNPLNNFREPTQDVDLYLAQVEGVRNS